MSSYKRSAIVVKDIQDQVYRTRKELGGGVGSKKKLEGREKTSFEIQNITKSQLDTRVSTTRIARGKKEREYLGRVTLEEGIKTLIPYHRDNHTPGMGGSVTPHRKRVRGRLAEKKQYI